MRSPISIPLRFTAEGGGSFRATPWQFHSEEDEHLYHSKGWCRELWIASLGMPAVLPPPEEEKEAPPAIGAARAQKARAATLKK